MSTAFQPVSRKHTLGLAFVRSFARWAHSRGWAALGTFLSSRSTPPPSITFLHISSFSLFLSFLPFFSFGVSHPSEAQHRHCYGAKSYLKTESFKDIFCLKRANSYWLILPCSSGVSQSTWDKLRAPVLPHSSAVSAKKAPLSPSHFSLLNCEPLCAAVHLH